MDRTAFLLTAALGAAIIVLYAFRCWKAFEAMNVATLVNIMLHSGGIVAGLFLILNTFIPDFKERLSSLEIYIFISGLVVCAVSVQGLKREIFPSPAKQPSPQSPAEGQPVLATVPATVVARVIGGSTDRVA